MSSEGLLRASIQTCGTATFFLFHAKHKGAVYRFNNNKMTKLLDTTAGGPNNLGLGFRRGQGDYYYCKSVC